MLKHQQLAVDEAMVLIKGRNSLRQYMPEKSAKWRFKCWCTCDATNGYMHHVYVYEGASETRDVDGLGAKVVQCMLEPVYNKHYVYMDDFFSSVQLANKLKFGAIT